MKMGLIVQKFGGTSVADTERLRNVARIITDTYKAGNQVVVVLSAQGDTTDDLIEKDKDRAEKILKDEMENAVKLAVPMTVDVNSGRSWYEAKD